MDVLFVCTGNTCRSPMAAAALAHLCRDLERPRLRVRSAGVAAVDGMLVSREARRTLAEAGIPLGDGHSRALTEAMVRDADLVVTMTRAHAREILRTFPWAADRVRLLLTFSGSEEDVPDPYGGNDAVYRHCLRSMAGALERLADDIRNDRPISGDHKQRNEP